MNFPQYGDLCIGRTKDYIVSGHFIGLIKLLDGVEYAVLQPRKEIHQFNLALANTLEPYNGVVTYRDRSNDPAKKVLPPLAHSKW